MQTIYLDISNKGVVPTIHAKQGDVGRKFQVVLTDSGLPYIPVGGSAFSVWYSGASGEGNYTEVGDKSAFSVSGNKVTVEMISQMLSNDGEGVLSLVLNDPNGNQISTWNIHYICECVPGAGSQEAKAYYTAFSQAVENLPYPDASLSASGKAADAAATGMALAGKAPAGYVSEKFSFTDYASALAHIKTVYASMNNNEKKCLFVDISGGSVYNGEFPSGAYFVEIYREWDNYGIVEFISSAYVKIIVRISGTWGDFCYENPPMVLGVEHSTTERWNDKVVYTKLIDLGALPNAGTKTVDNLVEHVDRIVDAVFNTARTDACFYNQPEVLSWYIGSYGSAYISITTNTDMSNTTARVALKYTKTKD